jgi:hypothetical protein
LDRSYDRPGTKRDGRGKKVVARIYVDARTHAQLRAETRRGGGCYTDIAAMNHVAAGQYDATTTVYGKRAECRRREKHGGAGALDWIILSNLSTCWHEANRECENDKLYSGANAR